MWPDQVQRCGERGWGLMGCAGERDGAGKEEAAKIHLGVSYR